MLARRHPAFRVGGLSHLFLIAFAAAHTLIAASATRAEPVQGIAMHGLPALPSAFPHLPYVNPVAPKGGRLRLGQLGSFDSLNPFIVKGVAAVGMREYVYESLLARSLDEPFSLYAHIAESLEVPDDRSFIQFNLRSQARFSDGTPLKPEDVRFSWELLRDKGQPYHRSYYKNVSRADVTGPDSIRFTFSGDNREMPLIIGLMPILPSHRISPDTFERTGFETPIGSGPYLVSDVDPGKRIVLRRDPNWWAGDLNTARGRFNFDEVRYEYFRDSTSMFEAFKAGSIDLREEDAPDRWATGYDFAAAADGRVLRRTFDVGTPSGMSAFALNTRRPVLADERVRRALILLFDFEWINRSLFNGLYTRTASYFDRSPLSTRGRPADDRERALLAPYADEVDAQILENGWQPPQSDGSGFNRDNARAAVALLHEAGYVLKGDRMVDSRSGKPLALEALARSRGQERLLLAFARSLSRVGVALAIRQVDDAQYWARLKSFDFDLLQWTWASSLSPGNEQLNRWSTAAADTPGALNLPGVRSLAADAMIEALLQAREREHFEAAVRALDRVLLSGHYVVPLFHLSQQWVAYWSHLAAPERAPLTGNSIDTWWSTEARQ